MNVENNENIQADLHNHTFASDGEQSPLKCILRANNRKKNIVSITDHNSVMAYKMLEKQVKYFSDKAIKNEKYMVAKRLLKTLSEIKIIPGVEIVTSYNGIIIEILGYNIDIDVLEKELKKKSEGLKTTKEVLYKGLSKIIEETNMNFDKAVIENVDILVKPFYKELMSHEENKKLFNDTKAVDTIKKFIYNYLYNPESKFFVDMSSTRPKLEDIIESIHKSKGKAFLAHVGRYKNIDIRKEIDEMISYGTDGIEVFYPDHDKELQEFLLLKAKEYGLKASGGSDDHCNPKEGAQYKIGTIVIPQISETRMDKNK